MVSELVRWVQPLESLKKHCILEFSKTSRHLYTLKRSLERNYSIRLTNHHLTLLIAYTQVVRR